MCFIFTPKPAYRQTPHAVYRHPLAVYPATLFYTDENIYNPPTRTQPPIWVPPKPRSPPRPSQAEMDALRQQGLYTQQQSLYTQQQSFFTQQQALFTQIQQQLILAQQQALLATPQPSPRFLLTPLPMTLLPPQIPLPQALPVINSRLTTTDGVSMFDWDITQAPPHSDPGPALTPTPSHLPNAQPPLQMTNIEITYNHPLGPPLASAFGSITIHSDSHGSPISVQHILSEIHLHFQQPLERNILTGLPDLTSWSLADALHQRCQKQNASNYPSPLRSDALQNRIKFSGLHLKTVDGPSCILHMILS